jgi:parallel beta-helix repeat protein
MKFRNPAFVAVPLLVFTSLLTAGPLDPPAGPITPSYKTITEVEPRIALSEANTPGSSTSVFDIVEPGSYYLTGNIDSSKCPIRIMTSDVTIDLNGFTISNTSLLPAIYGAFARSNITIRNGSIIRSGGFGIDISEVEGGLIENVTVKATESHGIWAGQTINIVGCTVSDCVGNGILAGGGCIITRCKAFRNEMSGIRAGGYGTISDCVVYENGEDGILTTVAANITRCVSVANGSTGISCSTNSSISECESFANQLFGFNAVGTTITNCVATDNYVGFSALNSTMRGCEGSSNSWGGFYGEGITVEKCIANNNENYGIEAPTYATITSCTIIGNRYAGIYVMENCVVQANYCKDNQSIAGSGAITVYGTDCRIEGNTCIDNSLGIQVTAGGNIIMRNTCSGNTQNWSIAANNSLAPIVNTTKNTSAVTSDSYAGSLGSTDPNANFTY